MPEQKKDNEKSQSTMRTRTRVWLTGLLTGLLGLLGMGLLSPPVTIHILA